MIKNEGDSEMIPKECAKREKTPTKATKVDDDNGDLTPRMMKEINSSPPKKKEMKESKSSAKIISPEDRLEESAPRRDKKSRNGGAPKPDVPKTARNLPSINQSYVSLTNVNAMYQSTSREIGDRFKMRKNRKERCAQFSEKRTSIYALPTFKVPKKDDGGA